MRFVTSLTVDSGVLTRLLELWESSGETRNPFSRVLVTPLFTCAPTLRIVRERLREGMGADIYFDSGGYRLQQGGGSYSELWKRLMAFYRDNRWADWYVLPDYPPTSRDSSNEVALKHLETMTGSKLFHGEMPGDLRDRALAVIQGRTARQVHESLLAYARMGVRYVGFGSFATAGKAQDINLLDQGAIELLQGLMRAILSNGLPVAPQVHAFGVSTPPAAYILQRLGISSFDSIAWLRSAGYGKVFLPYIRGYNVSHRSIRNGALTREEYSELRSLTRHACPFCENFSHLSASRHLRALHNLMVLHDIDGSTSADDSQVEMLMQRHSGRYFRLMREARVS